jgi:hypothetical protein
MTSRLRYFAIVVVVFILSCRCGELALAQAGRAKPAAARQETRMTDIARGTFEVKLTPQPSDRQPEDAALGRIWLDKQFQGDLVATSRGQMLTAMTDVKGSAGYTAIERVTGTLRGRAGTFVLQHTGTMMRGAPSLTITVVPDSGTDELAGLSGRMTISIADGKHSYELEYALDAAP